MEQPGWTIKEKIGMKGREGFTLLEVLVAVTIFAIGILAVASMQLTSIQGNAFGNEMTTATFLAQAQLERMKSVADVSTLATGGDASPIDENENSGVSGAIYNRSWTVAAGPSADSRQVSVTVNWRSGMGDHLVTLRTITRGNGE
jgi:type IV pilus assembly protein PilV